MIVYYTGTGNSRYAAEALAHHTGDEIFSATDAMCKGESAALKSEKPWVFVCPTYCWRIPTVFQKWINDGRFEGSRDAYFVMTCGADISNAEKHIKSFCAKKGFNFLGVQEVVMPENYLAMFAVPEEEECALIRKKADTVLENTSKIINAGNPIESKSAGLFAAIKSGPVNPAFYALCVNSKAFTVSDACISCEKCAKGCPVHGIKIENGKPVWTGDCTHCMACICGCPVSAIEYGKTSLGKPRYQCPHFDAEA